MSQSDTGARGQPTRQQSRLLSVPVVSWSLYDFANTIFSFAIVTRYFNEWVIQDQNSPDWYVSAMNVGVAVALVLTMPFLGAVADRYGKRKPFLIFFTAVSVTATAFLAQADSVLAALVVAGIAVFGFQSALAHYDPLLPHVAAPEIRGKVSGLGVGLGYVGTFIALIVLGGIVGESGDKQDAFVPTAVMYGLFALPCFLFVREARPRIQGGEPSKRIGAVLLEAGRQLLGTVRNLRNYRAPARLLVARFFYADALATVIVFMTVFLDRLGGFGDSGKDAVLGLSIACAAAGAFAAGRVVQGLGPRRVLDTILSAFVVALLLVSAAPSGALMWIVGPVAGITLGAVWTSDRLFLLRLTPPAVRGEFFAFYHLVGKLSSGLGPALWGFMVWLVHEQAGRSELVGSRWALAVLAVTTTIGWLMIRGLDDTQRYEEPEGHRDASVD